MEEEEKERAETDVVAEVVGVVGLIGVLGFLAMSCSLNSVLLERLGNCLYFKVDNCCNLGWNKSW